MSATSSTVLKAVLAAVLAALSVLSFAFPSGVAVAADGPVVTTTAGAVRGSETETYRRFLGIPYAAPPVGERRWTAPEPAAAWSGVREATAQSADCAQAVTPGLANPKSRFDEDCLYLNVVTPRIARSHRPVPVMVWVHGGGFSNGSGSDYDARRLAVTGHVMVVTINYRLGIFGFFGLPGLEGSGVFGLEDQQAALRWVRRNALAFGGDPRNVTLFGESAGAMSACAQLVSPSAKGLFDKVILQSGSCIQAWPKSMIWPGADAFSQFVPVEEVRSLGVDTARKVGCAGAVAIDCMRRVSVADLIKAWPLSRPAYGGSVLPRDPAEMLRLGEINRAPLIWGTTRDEWRASIGSYLNTHTLTADQYESFLRDAFGQRAGDVEAQYPPSADGSPGLAWAAVSTDNAWSCPTLTSVQLASRRTTVFTYEFADRDAPNPAYTVPPGFQLGAAHATELAYLFDLAGHRATLKPDQERLSQTMMRYWSRFAATGNPNGSGLPKWAPYRVEAAAQVESLGPSGGGIGPVDFVARHHCDFWQTIKSKS
jgi:para-nitrobenzyl esterase